MTLFMKLLPFVFLPLGTCECNEDNRKECKQSSDKESMLVVYFSKSGNTKNVAERIASKLINADVVEVVEKDYR